MVFVYQDGYIDCSLVDTLGCTACYQEFEEHMEEQPMCNDFECVHDQCGICSYTDQDCEYEECFMWDDCAECIYEFKCLPDREEEE